MFTACFCCPLVVRKLVNVGLKSRRSTEMWRWMTQLHPQKNHDIFSQCKGRETIQHHRGDFISRTAFDCCNGNHHPMFSLWRC